MPNFVYEGNDLEKEIEDAKQTHLPPLPRAIRENDKDKPKYDKDPDDMAGRVFFKLINLWLLWCSILEDEKTANLLKLDESLDQESDEYKLKCSIVDIIDLLGGILGNTNIAMECAWLNNIPEEIKKMHSDPN